MDKAPAERVELWGLLDRVAYLNGAGSPYILAYLHDPRAPITVRRPDELAAARDLVGRLIGQGIEILGIRTESEDAPDPVATGVLVYSELATNLSGAAYRSQ
jgi:hypothetical protein